MIIDAISDLHGYYPEMEGGDLLIVAGDLSCCDMWPCVRNYQEWIVKSAEKYKKTITIAGNHDGWILDREMQTSWDTPNIVYLQDSGTKFQGLNIWGSPWTPEFCGWDFMKERGAEIAERWSLIPDDTDILITHGPPYGILDGARKGEKVGCRDLGEAVLRVSPILHVFGHIHEGYGQFKLPSKHGFITFINASHVNENYQPINKPIRIEL